MTKPRPKIVEQLNLPWFSRVRASVESDSQTAISVNNLQNYGQDERLQTCLNEGGYDLSV